jgi:hypothetical protein
LLKKCGGLPTAATMKRSFSEVSGVRDKSLMELKLKPAGRNSRNSAKLALPDLTDNWHYACSFCPKERWKKNKIAVDKGAGVS